MSFLVTAALAIALFVVVPIAAHLLRRGRAQEREFPPALLVPPAPPVARQRSRLEDRALLAVRSLLLVALAALGAVPLVRCSRLSLAREAGASVALSLVLDDSASMRLATPAGASRWDRSVVAARDLLRSARDGDAIAIVLAGAPARLALAATTDLAAARATLDALAVTDRSTDVANAVKIARSALSELPQVDRRVVVLSDLAGDDLPAGSPPLWLPVPELATPATNCGVVHADRRGGRVTAEVACTSREAAQGRQLRVVVAEAPPPSATPAPSSAPGRQGAVVATAPIAEQSGAQTVVVDLPPSTGDLDVALTGRDASDHDDVAPVARERSATTIGVLTDPTSASAVTGGPPVVEQALRALESGAVIKPLTLLPEDTASLAVFSALILDDPGGFGPEIREALGGWLERGGVALALLGPSVGRAVLGATLDPFVAHSVSWSSTTAAGIDPATATSLGPEANGLATLAPRGRVALAGSVPGGARTLARWLDGEPFLLERDVGRGLVLTTALPATPTASDFALRPGFLALLAYAAEEAARRHGPRITEAGVAWVFPGEAGVRVTPPAGPVVDVPVERGPAGETRGVFTPNERGRYRVVREGQAEQRVVTLATEELTRPPRDPSRLTAPVRTGGAAERLDVSREAALVVLLFFALELSVRAVMRWRDRHRAIVAR